MENNSTMGFSQSRDISWMHTKGGPDLMEGESAKLLIMEGGVVVQGICPGGIGFDSKDISYIDIVYVSNKKIRIKGKNNIQGPNTNPYHILAGRPSVTTIPIWGGVPVKTYNASDTTINLYFDRDAYKPLEAKTITLINAGENILAVFNINGGDIRF